MHSGARVGPYLVLSRLGAGGMGEVWRARDERLGREVAIKVLPTEFTADPERLARFEREARATAALSHPNILAIHDVGIHGEQPYLVEELLEGESLRVRLLDGPLPVREALALGVQIARGLAAAHDKRIVHRDLKPDNVIVTREGTAKILDFGLAKIVEPVSGDADTITQAPSAATGQGQVMGSAAYMAPEQARGLPVDHRADIFAFGVLLHELLSGQRPFTGHTLSETVAAILKDEPEPLPEGVPAPVRALVRRCLEKRPEDRFGSARDIAFALQAQLEGAPRTAAKPRDEDRPYPGLSAFSEADSKRFFGRDEEIAALWRKIPARSLLALIGPSGVGKTSFLRAGLVSHAPPGWRCIVVTPGQAPFAALARALAPAFTGDAGAFQQLLDLHEPDVALSLIGRWRQRGDHGLIVVDQVEELFTLSPVDVQEHFAALLGRVATLEGVHVLLSMRDDFFFACHRFAPLAGVFESVTPLGPPSAAGLRQALLEPAKAMGFAFEDQALVGDMVHAVEGERGALPLLAFAAASLWERRDPETRQLTRSAYDAIGGVAGALAQHAEATLDRVGTDNLPLVRELFRNLTTSHQTRCALDVEELLSVFPEGERGDAGDALARLVDARLVTSFEVEAPDGSRHDRVEIVHESLLTAWPRLVRWRTEDEGGAQLRDQLRQAAHLWEEKGEPEDLLWTGTSYQEYQVWRVRYPGGLSEVEETFGRAMVARAGRRRRVRRLAAAAVLVVLLSVLGVIGTSLQRTRAALAHSDASGLVSLARATGVANDPTAVLAYATASLERADTAEGRHLALEALANGPVALRVDAVERTLGLIAMSPDGRWLAAAAPSTRLSARVWSRDGTSTTFPVDTEEWTARVDLAGEPPVLLTNVEPGDGTPAQWARAWELPEGRLLAEMAWTHPASLLYLLKDPERVADLWLGDGHATLRTLRLRQGAVPEVTSFDLRTRFSEWPRLRLQRGAKVSTPRQLPVIDPAGRWLAIPAGREIVLQPLTDGAPARVLARHAAPITRMAASPDGRIVAAADAGGETRLWAVDSGAAVASLKAETPAPGDPFAAVPNWGIQFSEDGATLLQADGEPEGTLRVWRLSTESPAPGRTVPLPSNKLWQGMYPHCFETDRTARWLAVPDGSHWPRVWNLRWPADARPVVLRRGPENNGSFVRIERHGAWAASHSGSGIHLWPLRDRSTRVLDGHTGAVTGVAFAPDGSWIASTSEDGSVRLRPLAGETPPAARQLVTATSAGDLGLPRDLEVSGDGRVLLLSFFGKDTLGRVAVRPIDGELRELTMSDNRESFVGSEHGVALSSDGRLAAAGGAHPGESIVRVWDVASGNEVTRLDAGDRSFWAPGLVFLPDGTLAAGGPYGVLLWDVMRGTSRALWAPDKPDPKSFVWPLRRSASGRFAFGFVEFTLHGRAYVLDPAQGPARRLDSHGDQVNSVAIDPTGEIIVTGSEDGVVRVGPATGETPHLLLGHTGPVYAVAISRSGEWIASGGADTTVRLWPMPDVTKPAPHTLPLPDLLAKLKAQTNWRVVTDPAAPGGYRLEPGPFPGWAVVPEWSP